jgi:hypothetical protein
MVTITLPDVLFISWATTMIVLYLVNHYRRSEDQQKLNVDYYDMSANDSLLEKMIAALYPLEDDDSTDIESGRVQMPPVKQFDQFCIDDESSLCGWFTDLMTPPIGVSVSHDKLDRDDEESQPTRPSPFWSHEDVFEMSDDIWSRPPVSNFDERMESRGIRRSG